MTSSATAAAGRSPGLRASNGSDMDGEVQANQPLFLTFTPGLGAVNESKRQKRKSHVYKVSGVNILNRNSVDSKTALQRLQRRRENHNFVERRRRDNINHTITMLSTLIPSCADDGAKLNKGSILQKAVDYIRDLQDINTVLVAENQRLGGTGHVELPPRVRQYHDSLPGTAHHSHDEDEDDEDDDEDEEEDMPLSSTAASSPSAAIAGNKRGSGSSSSSSRRSSPARDKRRAVAPHAAAATNSAPTACPPSAAASPVGLPPTSALLLPLPGAPLAAAHSVSRPLCTSGSVAHMSLPPIGAVTSPQSARAPAQSVPSSPSFRPHGSGGPIRSADLAQHQPAMAGLGTHPFFSSDVSSIRHHLNPIPQLRYPHPPRALGTQSLQTTPLMRPVRGPAGDHLTHVIDASAAAARHYQHMSVDPGR